MNRFTLGELICRGDAVILHMQIEAIQQRMLQLDTAEMLLKDKVEARNMMSIEIKKLNHDYNFLVVD